MPRNNKSRQIIYGRNSVIEALRSNLEIEKIYILYGTKGPILKNITDLANRKSISCVQVDKKKFSEIAEIEKSQGVVAIAAQKEYVEVEDILLVAKNRGEKNFIIILDEIQDPQNLGAIIRTAECAGVHGVIIPKHNAASITSAVLKASAGAAEYMLVAKVNNLAQTIDELKKSGIWIIGSDSSASKIYTQQDYNFPLALVIGSEGKGMRRLIRDKCDFLVKIPLHGKIGSLNASVAAGIILYEIRNQRLKS